MSHEHNHTYSKEVCDMPLEKQLAFFKRALARLESGEDERTHLIECAKYDIDEVRKKMQQELIDDAAVIYHLTTPPRE